MRRYILLGAALSLSLSLTVAVQAAEPLKPTDQQLKALCDGCAVVTAVHTASRKGQASGVGAVGGAVGGAVVGKQIGDSGVATVGGAVIGGLLGSEIEKRVKKHTVWIISAKGRDGTEQRYELAQDPHLKAGDTVRPEGKGLKKR